MRRKKVLAAVLATVALGAMALSSTGAFAESKTIASGEKAGGEPIPNSWCWSC